MGYNYTGEEYKDFINQILEYGLRLITIFFLMNFNNRTS